MGLGIVNEVITLGAVLARIRFLNIGLSPTHVQGPQAEQKQVYQAAVDFAGTSAPLTGRCLEICAGFGAGISLLERYGSWHVEGIDGSPVATTFARLRGLDVKRSSLEAMPYDSNQFDHIVGIECLVCLSKPEVGLGEIARVLKPGGVATIAEFRKGRITDARELLEQRASTAGLSMMKFQDMSGAARQSVIATAQRRKRWVRGVPPPFRSWASEYASLPGSTKYAQWETGKRCYYLACLQKPV